MRRPGPPVIFLATFIAMLVMVLMVTTVSAVSLPDAATAALAPNPVQGLTPQPERFAAQETLDEAPPEEPTPTHEASAIQDAPPTFVNKVQAGPNDDLEAFAQSVTDGQAGVVRGVFAPGLFAYPVTGQPAGNATWVSNEANEVTLFSAAAEYGVTALLAHNTLAGYVFDGLQSGDAVILVYGDGATVTYRITGAETYQALQPTSGSSDFLDLNGGQMLSAGELFTRIYTGTYPLVLQTCIEKDGNTKWGRLFLTGAKE